MNKKMLLSLILTFLVFLLCACTNNEISNSVDSPTIEFIYDTDTPTTVSNTSEVDITEMPALIGEYDLDECKNRNGIFIAYNDGSFDLYRSNGYCLELHPYSTYCLGMFQRDSIVNELPEITQETNMVLFWEGDYSLTLWHVNGVSTAVSTSENGTRGYGLIDQNGSPFTIYYQDNSFTRLYPLYINGVKREDFHDINTIKWEYRPYKGMSQSYEHSSLSGFEEGATIIISTADGTTLTEKTYHVDSKYYDCAADHNDFDFQDSYTLSPTPTPDGYAQLDFSGVPSGQYVLIVRNSIMYIATLVNVI